MLEISESAHMSPTLQLWRFFLEEVFGVGIE